MGLTTTEGLCIAAMTAGVTWLMLKKAGDKAPPAVGPSRRRDGGILVNAWERTPLQAAYDRDVTRTVTCPHLQPLERSIRAAGHHVHMFDPVGYGAQVRADCRLNMPEARRALGLADCVHYHERYRPDISDREEPEAGLYCSECLHETGRKWDMLVSHPMDGSKALWFPAPPPGVVDGE